jgi:hypothetical protein
MTDRTTPTVATWSAIAMGLLVGLVVQILLNLFGLSLGLSAIGPAAGQPLAAADVPLAALAWWSVSTAASLFAAGFVVGWLRRRQGFVDTAIFASTAWSLSTLLAVWFASTVTGSAISGAYGLLFATPPAQPDIRITLEQKLSSESPSGTTPVVQTVPAPPTPDRSLMDAIQSLTWIAMIEAARQLRDPDVRSTVKQITWLAWEDMQQFRGTLARKIDRWVAPDGTIDDRALEELQRWLREALLIDRDTAGEIVEHWGARLQTIIRQPERTNGGDTSGSAGGSRSETSANIARALESFKNELVAALAELRETAIDVIRAGGVLDPEQRRKAIADIEGALAVTKDRAERVLASWENRIHRAYRELVRTGSQVQQDTVELTQQGLAETARLAAWMATALLFGWIATLFGAFLGTRLSRL